MTNGESTDLLSKYSIDSNNLIKLSGPWDLGYAIQLHSISSTPIDPARYIYDTTYTPVGGLLHKYKYNGLQASKPDLVNIATAIITLMFDKLPIDILTIPPSNVERASYQPMEEIAKSISSNLEIEFQKIIAQKEIGKTMKNMGLKHEKKSYLSNNLDCSENNIKNKNVLIIDDIFDSGATLETCTEKLKEHKCENVYILTFTKTR